MGPPAFHFAASKQNLKKNVGSPWMLSRAALTSHVLPGVLLKSGAAFHIQVSYNGKLDFTRFLCDYAHFEVSELRVTFGLKLEHL